MVNTFIVAMRLNNTLSAVIDPEHLEITLLPSIDAEDTSKGTYLFLKIFALILAHSWRTYDRGHIRHLSSNSTNYYTEYHQGQDICYQQIVRTTAARSE